MQQHPTGHTMHVSVPAQHSTAQRSHCTIILQVDSNAVTPQCHSSGARDTRCAVMPADAPTKHQSPCSTPQSTHPANELAVSGCCVIAACNPHTQCFQASSGGCGTSGSPVAWHHNKLVRSVWPSKPRPVWFTNTHNAQNTTHPTIAHHVLAALKVIFGGVQVRVSHQCDLCLLVPALRDRYTNMTHRRTAIPCCYRAQGFTAVGGKIAEAVAVVPVTKSLCNAHAKPSQGSQL